MKPQYNLDAVTPEAIQRHLQKVNRTLANISFGSTIGNKDADRNIDCWKATGTSPGVADTEFAVTHSLGRIPVTLAGQDTNNGGVIYRSTTAWSKTQVFLKCSKASSVYNIVII